MSKELMRTEVGAEWIERDVLRASGVEVTTFLQGQLSQDVTQIEIGSSALSFVLQPHGKVDAFVRVTRIGESEFVLDTDVGWGELLVERLNRFKMRTKVDFEQLDWKVLALRGNGALAVAGPQSAAAQQPLISDAHWRQAEGVDLLGIDVDVPAGASLAGGDFYEALRIESGMPKMGAELDDKSIPAEAGVNELAISFDKGCYTGQELVARIDSRGNNVARHLRGLVLEGTEVPLAGSSVVAAGPVLRGAKPWGRVTSAAFSSARNAPVALAYVRRDIFPPREAMVEVDEVMVPCRIEKLPLLP